MKKAVAYRTLLGDTGKLTHYKSHNDNYYCDPVGEIKRAVDELAQSNEWHDNWDQFVDAMVFAKQKPSYQDVLSNLHEKTNLVLSDLSKLDFEILRE